MKKHNFTFLTGFKFNVTTLILAHHFDFCKVVGITSFENTPQKTPSSKKPQATKICQIIVKANMN